MSDSSEGITFYVPASPLPEPRCSMYEEKTSHRQHGLSTATGGNRLPAAGSFWHEDYNHGPGGGGAAAGRCPKSIAPAATSASTSRRTTVVYVINECTSGMQVCESAALRSLQEACESQGATLDTLQFGKLDFGETAGLDRFYNAGT